MSIQGRYVKAPSADFHERRLYLVQKLKRTPPVLDRVLGRAVPFVFKSRPLSSKGSYSSRTPPTHPRNYPNLFAPATLVVPAPRVTGWGRNNAGAPLLLFRPPFLRGLRRIPRFRVTAQAMQMELDKFVNF